MTEPIQKYNPSASYLALHMTAASGVGYFCSRGFTVINPFAGGAFCAFTVLVSKFANPFFDGLFNRKGAGEISKSFAGFCSTVSCIVGATGLAQLCGFAITLYSSCVLICTIIAIKVIATLALAMVTAIVTR